MRSSDSIRTFLNPRDGGSAVEPAYHVLSLTRPFDLGSLRSEHPYSDFNGPAGPSFAPTAEKSDFPRRNGHYFSCLRMAQVAHPLLDTALN